LPSYRFNPTAEEAIYGRNAKCGAGTTNGEQAFGIEETKERIISNDLEIQSSFYTPGVSNVS
jgi:hypothetical protein